MTDPTRTPGSGDVIDPIEPGTRVIFHRGYHLELEEDYGGGFSQGEFLLRSDGVLFNRSVTRSVGPWPDGPKSPWRRDETWEGVPDARALSEWLSRRGHEIDGSVFPIVADGARDF
jgi:hypothetical protein